MRPGTCRFGSRCCPVLLAVLLSGCFRAERRDDDLPPLPVPVDPAKLYTLACPDVVEISFIDRPDDAIRTAAVNTEGEIDLGSLGKVRVEGMTLADARQAIAQRVRCAAGEVQIRVAKHRSRKIFLYGEAAGAVRAVSYRGPETVVDLLRRTGAITPDSAWNEIHLVRSHLAEGAAPEVLRIDLDAILQRNDNRTNVRIQPLDEIYIGEKRSAYFRRAIPGFLRPMYDTVVGLIPERRDK
ncbi:MAG TPA: polysaccharide biosynthesis/export family protein [Gemmataceae bacterium]|nr:polysaccharide biosynthesis/export family protein [Gemmataceae bacterium]